MYTDPNDLPLPTTPNAQGRYTRRVEHARVLDAPGSFRSICRVAVPRDTGVLVLDLDKTCFLGLNMGELLGWELVAREAYGDAHLDTLYAAHSRPARKLFLDSHELAGSARYMKYALRQWAWPGLTYLFNLSLPSRFSATHRLLYRVFGADPVQAVQSVPQMNLLHQLSRLPKARAVELVRRLFERFSGAAVITPADITWLRQTWCPGVKIVLASGSPTPVVEAAAAHLGIRTAIGTEIEEVNGVMSAPPFFKPLSANAAEPHRIAPLSSIRINTGVRKIAHLRERLPELFEGERTAPLVGITDTDHGEDHCWAEHFDHLIDLNSPAPFSPITGAHSPLRSILSARAFTQDGHTAPEPPAPPRTVHNVRHLHARVEALTRQLARLRREQARPSSHRSALLRAMRSAESRIEVTIADYNETPPGTAIRTATLATLKQELASREKLDRDLARSCRKSSELIYDIRHLQAAARRLVPRHSESAPLPATPRSSPILPGG